MKVAVINLEHRVDRRLQFAAWNRGQPLPFEIFPAADGERLDKARLIAGGIIAMDETHFGPGALGNALSHSALWRACAAGSEPYLIFEDDACLRGDFWKHAKPILQRQLPHEDMVVLGHNTDSVVALRGSDGVVSAMRFDESIKRQPGYFDRYTRLHDAKPNLFRCVQFWGLLAYAVSPAGARALLGACLPLSSRETVTLFGTGRAIRPYGLDSMVNLALAKGRLSALACYPALALGPNSHTTSDIQSAAPAPRLNRA